MKTKGISPKDFVLGLLKRSDCAVQVGACLSDKTGIYAWAVNHAGDGYGMCAERECLRRANYKRVAESTMWIAARRRKSKNAVLAKPCAACWPAVSRCSYIIYRKKDQSWETLDPSLVA